MNWEEILRAVGATDDQVGAAARIIAAGHASALDLQILEGRGSNVTEPSE